MKSFLCSLEKSCSAGLKLWLCAGSQGSCKEFEKLCMATLSRQKRVQVWIAALNFGTTDPRRPEKKQGVQPTRSSTLRVPDSNYLNFFTLKRLHFGQTEICNCTSLSNVWDQGCPGSVSRMQIVWFVRKILGGGNRPSTIPQMRGPSKARVLFRSQLFQTITEGKGYISLLALRVGAPTTHRQINHSRVHGVGGLGMTSVYVICRLSNRIWGQKTLVKHDTSVCARKCLMHKMWPLSLSSLLLSFHRIWFHEGKTETFRMEIGFNCQADENCLCLSSLLSVSDLLQILIEVLHVLK